MAFVTLPGSAFAMNAALVLKVRFDCRVAIQTERGLAVAVKIRVAIVTAIVRVLVDMVQRARGDQHLPQRGRLFCARRRWHESGK